MLKTECLFSHAIMQTWRHSDIWLSFAFKGEYPIFLSDMNFYPPTDRVYSDQHGIRP